VEFFILRNLNKIDDTITIIPRSYAKNFNSITASFGALSEGIIIIKVPAATQWINYTYIFWFVSVSVGLILK
jgi:hypothetical protein